MYMYALVCVFASCMQFLGSEIQGFALDELKCSRCCNNISQDIRRVSNCTIRCLTETAFVLEQQRLSHVSELGNARTEWILVPLAHLEIPSPLMKHTEDVYVVVYCGLCTADLQRYQEHLPAYIIRRPNEFFNIASEERVTKNSVWNKSLAIRSLARLCHPWVELICPVGGSGSYDVTDRMVAESPALFVLEQQRRSLRTDEDPFWHSMFPESSVVVFNQLKSDDSSLEACLEFLRIEWFKTFLSVCRVSWTATSDADSGAAMDEKAVLGLDNDDPAVTWSNADNKKVARFLQELSRMAQEINDTLDQCVVQIWVMKAPRNDKLPDSIGLDIMIRQQELAGGDFNQTLQRRFGDWTPDTIDDVFAKQTRCFANRNLVMRHIAAAARPLGVPVDLQRPSTIASVGDIALTNFKSWGYTEHAKDVERVLAHPRANRRALFHNCYPPEVSRAWGLKAQTEALTAKEKITTRPFFIEMKQTVSSSGQRCLIPKVFEESGDANFTAFVKEGRNRFGMNARVPKVLAFFQCPVAMAQLKV